MVSEAPKRKKRRKKRRAVDAAEAPGALSEGANETAKSEETKSEETKAARRSRARFVWPLVLGVGLLELWIFGNKGEIQVCVAREGEHDFSLIGQPRTDENTRRYPTCEKRFDLGLRGHYDERVEDAALHACRRATILRGRDHTIACFLQRGGWQHRIETRWVAPWEAPYYERLFWFLQ